MAPTSHRNGPTLETVLFFVVMASSASMTSLKEMALVCDVYYLFVMFYFDEYIVQELP